MALSREIEDAVVSAAQNGDVKMLKQLFAKHPEIADGKEFLEWCLQYADGLGVIQVLVEHGADVCMKTNPPSPEGLVASYKVQQSYDILEWLLSKGAHVNCVVDGQKRCFALSTAAGHSNLAAVKLLVKYGADVNAYWAGSNALSDSIEAKRPAIVKYLRSVGAKTPEEQGWTPSDDEDEDLDE